MTRAHQMLGGFAGVLSVVAIVWASRLEVTLPTTGEGVLRLAWRIRTERIDNCYERTEAELVALPVHMRQKVVCEGAMAAYRLEVTRDGRVLAAQDVRGGGLRQDRPLYLYRDINVPPGPGRIRVEFSRIGGGPPESARAGAGDSARAGGAPAEMTFEETIHFTARAVVLVTYDPEARRLVRR